MAQYTAKTANKLKAQVKGPSTTYTYNITAGEWASFPLSDGNGSYKITVYENVRGNSYASVLSLTTNVTLTDEFGPFLHSNQYVDFDAAPKTVAKAAELVGEPAPPTPRSGDDVREDDPVAFEDDLSGDRAGAGPAVAWGAICAGIWIIAWAIGRIRPRVKWPAYFVGIVPFMVCLFLFFENFSRLLPANF